MQVFSEVELIISTSESTMFSRLVANAKARFDVNLSYQVVAKNNV